MSKDSPGGWEKALLFRMSSKSKAKRCEAAEGLGRNSSPVLQGHTARKQCFKDEAVLSLKGLVLKKSGFCP